MKRSHEEGEENTWFEILVEKEVELYETKNSGYATRTQDEFGNFNRVSKIMEEYPGIRPDDATGILLMYVMKHFDNILWNAHRGTLANVPESMRDIAVYMKILMKMTEEDE